MGSEHIELEDLAATHALAARLAGELRPGDVVALTGELGAGKTEWTRGLARALDVPEQVSVASPSYLLLNVYRGGRHPIAHFDAYFMQSDDDLERAGLAEAIREGCIVVIEWADRVAAAVPPGARWLDLQPAADSGAREAVLRHGHQPAERDR
ncbi:MAG: tRNA (adenosine(37)-N6)-threonylcarbamoyltransferase complex ATPase subunit type 1 TsaE [Planctomycetota bacterium]|jgi:tRNA threonylcarbamoyladenosine biosynthesis protein TsaE